MTDIQIISSARQKNNSYLTVRGDISVETWWDRTSRNWITQTKKNGNQIGDSFFGSNRGSAESNHILAVKI